MNKIEKMDILYGQNQNAPTYCPFGESVLNLLLKNGFIIRECSVVVYDQYARQFIADHLGVILLNR